MNVPLRARALGLFAVALVALTIIARAAGFGARFLLVVSIIFAAVMLVAIGWLRGTHPFDRFGPANQITTARAALVAFVAGLIGEPPTEMLASTAASVALATTILDGVDGWLARRSGIASEFGARFDLEIDALLIMALAILVWRYDKAGAWILLAGLMRYLFIAAGAIWRWLRRPLPLSRRRQAICIVQIIGLIVTIVPFVKPPLSAMVAAMSLAALCYSFLIDIVWLWRNAR